jgi:hypothetical protein
MSAKRRAELFFGSSDMARGLLVRDSQRINDMKGPGSTSAHA